MSEEQGVKEYLARMRHDLCTPINAILGYSDLMLEDAEEAGKQDLAAVLAQVNAAGERILAAIQAVIGKDRVAAVQGEGVARFAQRLDELLATDLDITSASCISLKTFGNTDDEFQKDLLQMSNAIEQIRLLLGEMSSFAES